MSLILISNMLETTNDEIFVVCTFWSLGNELKNKFKCEVKFKEIFDLEVRWLVERHFTWGKRVHVVGDLQEGPALTPLPHPPPLFWVKQNILEGRKVSLNLKVWICHWHVQQYNYFYNIVHNYVQYIRDGVH